MGVVMSGGFKTRPYLPVFPRSKLFPLRHFFFNWSATDWMAACTLS